MTQRCTSGEAAHAIRAAAAALAQDWIEPPVLQPADIYLELAGEDLRARAYLLEGDDGLCVRPDMTAPAVRMALQRMNWEKAFGVGYDGLVFRRRDADHDDGEFRQVGMERFDRTDALAQQEAMLVRCALEACRALKITPRLRLGVIGVFNALVDAVDLSPGWTRRIKRAFGRPGGLSSVLAHAQSAADEPSHAAAGSLAQALSSLSQDDAERIVGDLLNDARITIVGARPVAEIAARLRAKGSEEAHAPDRAQVSAIAEAVTLTGAPDKVLRALDQLTHQAAMRHPGIAREAIARAAARWSGIGAQEAEFSAGFGRGLAYYDGLVFELEAPSLGIRRSLGGGGRYDGLLHRLAAKEHAGATDLGAWGAMGFALRPDRLAEAAP